MDFKIFLIYLIIISSVYNSSIEEVVQMGLKEVVYRYYMRGKYIQYNIYKGSIFSPEEANKQNLNFLDCSAFTRNIYYELIIFSLLY